MAHQVTMIQALTFSKILGDELFGKRIFPHYLTKSSFEKLNNSKGGRKSYWVNNFFFFPSFLHPSIGRLFRVKEKSRISHHYPHHLSLYFLVSIFLYFFSSCNLVYCAFVSQLLKKGPLPALRQWEDYKVLFYFICSWINLFCKHPSL